MHDNTRYPQIAKVYLILTLLISVMHARLRYGQKIFNNKAVGLRLLAFI